MIDHGRADAQALAHLRALGHCRVAFIKGQAFSSDTAIRWQTIRAAARVERIAIDPALVGQLEGNSPLPDLGYAVTPGLLRVRPRPGFDDIPSAACQHPGLTTIRQPLYEMRQCAADTLLARIEQPAIRVPRTISLQPSLIVRGTTARPCLEARRARP